MHIVLSTLTGTANFAKVRRQKGAMVAEDQETREAREQLETHFRDNLGMLPAVAEERALALYPRDRPR